MPGNVLKMLFSEALDIICTIFCRGEFKDVELVIMGSTRHRDDELLLQALQETVREWHLQDHVRFVANGTYSELKHYMSVAQIGNTAFTYFFLFLDVETVPRMIIISKS